MTRFFFLLLLLSGLRTAAQGPLSLAECEALFQKNNLRLLAAHFNVEAARAQIIQAKLFENPYVTADLNLFNPERHRWLDVGATGQKAVAIQQLVYLGGKRKKGMDLATKNAEAAARELEDLLRHLRFELRQAYFRLYYNEQALVVADRQLAQLDSLVGYYEIQVAKGTLPLRDLVRLQTLQVGVRATRHAMRSENAELRERLALLTTTDTISAVRPAPEEADRYERRLHATLPELEAMALINRADLSWALVQQEAAQVNLRLQQALSVPDLTLGLAYDQRSGPFNNQVNLTIGAPLRLWNRNQGNIRAAQAQSGRAAAVRADYEQTVRREVATAYAQYEAARAHFDSFTPERAVRLDEVYTGMLRNFQRRNVALVEFTDFMESYNEALIHYNNARKTLMESCEQINLTTGTLQF
ncbi:TolC family protein [Flaviaesturariibacter flavus]|uniref:TolC family protein n=1 Tax=Flaviaesturariibacter flavus TaxID=2502780 RepID=A0A4R1B849_9BACT|nr:TolC family protein [Flaviaesturariibacter flavus]TCJ12173.1 TolC family protein [Flaviaesturariibacter flavus]